MTASQPVASRPSSGRTVVAAIVLLGLVLAGFAFWFQWRQTRRCLDFLGPDVATLVGGAERVELWRLAAGSGPRRLVAVDRKDVTRARGLVHLRHALVEDASYVWKPGPAARESAGATPVAAWTLGLAFYDREDAAAPAAVLAFDLRQGWMTVVGRPGRVALGRFGAGLGRWVEMVAKPADPPPAP
jgi:hypothetical protein